MDEWVGWGGEAGSAGLIIIVISEMAGSIVDQLNDPAGRGLSPGPEIDAARATRRKRGASGVSERVRA